MIHQLTLVLLPSNLVQIYIRLFCGTSLFQKFTALAWATRMGTFFLPYNMFTELFALAAPYMPDWKTHNKHR